MSSPVACLIFTTSGRLLLVCELETSLPFHYVPLALLLASFVPFAPGASFCHLELANGFHFVVSFDLRAHVAVAVICPTASSGKEFAQLKSMFILQQLQHDYPEDLYRLQMESGDQMKHQAETYTLTRALETTTDETTVDALGRFQTEFVALILETTRQEIDKALETWTMEVQEKGKESNEQIQCIRGFLMNAESGNVVYDTEEKNACQVVGVSKSIFVQEQLQHVAKALAKWKDKAQPVVVKFRHEMGEFCVALRLISIGPFATGVVFLGSNPVEIDCRASDLQGKHLLESLQEHSHDVELGVGIKSAPNEVWDAMDLLLKPFSRQWQQR